MKAVYASLLLAMPLAGCFSDQEAQMAKCQYEVQRAFPNENFSLIVSSIVTRGGNLDPTTDALEISMLRLVEACMKGNGYEWLPGRDLHPRCNSVSRLAGPLSAFCYRPTGGPLTYRLELWWTKL